MTITAVRDKLRLTIGDTDATAPVFSDEELDWFLSVRADDVLLAGADAADAAAAKYARAFDFSTDQQSFKRSAMYEHFMALAKTLRARASGLVVGPGGALIGTVSTIDSTRIDGFSDDVPNQAVGVTATNPRRRFYGPDDSPPF
jgi:hypothetical protein